MLYILVVQSKLNQTVPSNVVDTVPAASKLFEEIWNCIKSRQTLGRVSFVLAYSTYGQILVDM